MLNGAGGRNLVSLRPPLTYWYWAVFYENGWCWLFKLLVSRNIQSSCWSSTFFIHQLEAKWIVVGSHLSFAIVCQLLVLGKCFNVSSLLVLHLLSRDEGVNLRKLLWRWQTRRPCKRLSLMPITEETHSKQQVLLSLDFIVHSEQLFNSQTPKVRDRMAIENKIQNPGPNNEDLAQMTISFSQWGLLSKCFLSSNSTPLPHSSLTFPPCFFLPSLLSFSLFSTSHLLTYWTLYNLF